MRASNGISRRHLLELAGASGLAFAGGIRASAQGAKRIEKLDPGLDKIIETSEPIKDLADGFGGTLGPAADAAPPGPYNPLAPPRAR